MGSNDLSEALQFTFGLINANGKYLTAETFGFKIAASGPSLKKKQTWSLVQRKDGAEVYFKSHLGRFLGADRNGKVTCEDETEGEENAFQVEATPDGRWAIKSSKYNRYFGGSDDNLSCYEQAISNNYLWAVHLAMHPQVNLFNIRRKTYAHVVSDNEVQMTKLIPWGVETLITLVFSNRAYALLMSDNTYLACDGSLQKDITDKALFTIEFYAGKIAFKSVHDKKYLSPIGPKGTLQTRKAAAGKDEQFTLEDSHPQITLVSKTKNKFVSGKQGLQLSANQMEAEESETFQLEMDVGSDKVHFHNDKGKYWRLDGNGVKGDASNASDAGADFELEWHGRTVRIKTCSGKYVSVLPSGHLSVVTDGQPEDFVLRLTNRSLIVFRGEFGFMGCRGDKIEGNRANYDIFQLEDAEGAYYVKAPNGKYLSVGSDKKVGACSSTGVPFLIQLCKGSKLAIKSEDGDYITSDHVGILTASVADISKKTLWEY